MEWTFNRILKSNGIKIFKEMAEGFNTWNDFSHLQGWELLRLIVDYFSPTFHTTVLSKMLSIFLNYCIILNYVKISELECFLK